jgi:hypothetical protein
MEFWYRYLRGLKPHRFWKPDAALKRRSSTALYTPVNFIAEAAVQT